MSGPGERPLGRAVLPVLTAVFAALLVGGWAAGRTLVVPRTVAGPSMRPALLEGDRVTVDLWTYRHRPPRVGEVLLLLDPQGRPIFKRVAPDPFDGRGERIWVLGDNPAASRDSRHFGGVPPDRVRGRVAWRYWPLSRFGPVR